VFIQPQLSLLGSTVSLSKSLLATAFKKSRRRIRPPLRLSSGRVFKPNLSELGRTEVTTAEEASETRRSQG